MSSINNDLKVLIENMVVLDPSKRWTVEECLASAYFDDIRSSAHEKQSSFELHLAVDKPGVYSYQDHTNLMYTRAQTK